jgi:multicomponent Na+:H+ antiporter subunit F
MTATSAAAVDASIVPVLAMIVVAMILALARVAIGPALPDRVVALDVAANLAVGVIAASAIAFDQPALLQPALVIALVAFLGTVAFAWYLERTRT